MILCNIGIHVKTTGLQITCLIAPDIHQSWKQVTWGLKTLSIHYLFSIYFFSSAHFYSFKNVLAFVLAISLPYPAAAPYFVGFSKSFIGASSITLFFNLHQVPVLKYKGLSGLAFFTSHLSPLHSWKSQLQESYHGKNARTKCLTHKVRASAMKSENVQA